MQKLRLCFASLAPIVLLAGCASTSGLGERAGGARLPTGVTLLRSEQERCTGAVRVIDESRSSRNGEIVVRQGENATLAIDDEDEVEWSCGSESSQDSDRVDCPNETSHVRVTRAASGSDVLFECYGS